MEGIAAIEAINADCETTAGRQKLSNVLKPGGFLFGRFSAEPNEDRPMHVVQDFEPTFRRLRELGFIEVWQDKWLWGQQVFQKLNNA